GYRRVRADRRRDHQAHPRRRPTLLMERSRRTLLIWLALIAIFTGIYRSPAFRAVAVGTVLGVVTLYLGGMLLAVRRTRVDGRAGNVVKLVVVALAVVASASAAAWALLGGAALGGALVTTVGSIGWMLGRYVSNRRQLRFL